MSKENNSDTLPICTHCGSENALYQCCMCGNYVCVDHKIQRDDKVVCDDCGSNPNET